MKHRKYPRRLTVDITDKQAEGLERIPWGLRKPLFQEIIDQINAAMDKREPTKVVAALLAGDIRLKDLL